MTNKPTSDMVRKEKMSNRHTQTSISYGKKEKALLTYLLENNKDRFNIRAYSRFSNVPRPSIYDLLNKFISKNIVAKIYTGDYKLTELGQNIAKEVCRNSSWGVSETMSELSTHYLKYKIKIEEKTMAFESRLPELNYLKKHTVHIPNQEITYLYFSDATIILHKHQFIIRVHNIVNNDSETAHLDAFNKALEYISKLSNIGLKGSHIELETTHWGRVQSILSDVLKKIDEHYFVDLGDGKKFWIDYSEGKKQEDETNDLEARQKIDQLMKDVVSSDNKFSDIDKIIQALGLVAKIETTKLVVENQKTPHPMPIKEFKRIDYVG